MAHIESLERRRLFCIDHLGHNTLMPRQVGDDPRADALLTPLAGPATEDAWTQGNKSVLYIRVAFSDAPAAPETLAQSQANFAEMNQFWADNSFGTLSFTPTFTDVIVLPRAGSSYSDTGLLADARAAAKAANPAWNYLDYDLDAIRYVDGPGNFAGQAYIYGRGVWLKHASWTTAAHEFGHNLGLLHANASTPSTAAAVVGEGRNYEYGDSFDVMGFIAPGQQNDFNAWEKKELGWINADNTKVIDGSGTYRLYANDLGGPLAAGLTYGLRFTRGDSREYWIDFRQDAGWASNAGVMNGVGLRWGGREESNWGTQYLDTTPLSPGDRLDGNLEIGRTFSDRLEQMHVTPLLRHAAAADAPPSIDVRVHFGTSPNAPAISSLDASALSIQPGQSVNFAASATDSDGDELAYSWTFGDGTFSVDNAPTQVKSFTTAGVYRVRLAVSDMKGNVTSRSVLITVGAPSTGSISGIVADASGRPIAGVIMRVGSGSGGTFPFYALTDDEGRYTLTNLPAGNYTFRGTGLEHDLNDGIVTSAVVVAGQDTSGKNFIATPRKFSVGGPVQRNGVSVNLALTYRASDGTVVQANGNSYQWQMKLPAGVHVVTATNATYVGQVAVRLEYDSGGGTISVYRRGDCDGSGTVNNADIDAFVQALTDPAAFTIAHPSISRLVADLNADGEVNNLDIAPFVALLTGSRPASVPTRKTSGNPFADSERAVTQLDDGLSSTPRAVIA